MRNLTCRGSFLTVMTGSRLAALIAVAVLIAGAATAAGQQPGGAPTQISASGSPQDFDTNSHAPVLSADRVSRRVLAVWRVVSTRSPTVVARVLDENGQPLALPVVLRGLSDAHHGYEVVSRPGVGGWIIVAALGRVDVSGVPGGPITQTSTVVAVVVSADGVVGPLRRISPVERLVQADTKPFVSGATLSKPSIAVDRRSGRAVVAWYRTASPGSGSGVYARAIDAEGRPLTPVQRIYAATGKLPHHAGEVALGYLSKARRWIAVWRQREVDRSATLHISEKHFVRRILITGRPRGRVRSIAPTDLTNEELRQDDPPVVVETANGGALVLLARGPRYGAAPLKPTLQLVRLRSNGVPLTRRARVVASTSGPPLYPASPRMMRDPATGQFVLVYAEGCDPAVKDQCPLQRILAQRLSSAGERLDAAKVLVPEVFDGTVGLARTSSGPLLLAWPGIILKGAVLPSADYPPHQPRKSEILVARAPL